MKKSVVVTIRFSDKEMRELGRYLRRNVYFDSLSSLGRVATMEFVRTRTALALEPHGEQEGKTRLWFLWDYDLTEAEVRELLTHAPFEQRRWLLARMLERLGPEELVKYVSLKAVRRALPHLRLDEKIRRHWEEAVALWTQPAPTF
ncbi:MAG: hypothetical protein HY353_00855 [Candidatus Omnitrophica bacterium]|nr:hypothetical protein [Candidatus Omnitrophota bacterium]